MKKFSRKNSKRTYRKGKKSTKKRGSSSLKKLIKSTIQRSAEKKISNYVNLGQSVITANSSGAAGLIIPLTPYTGGIDIIQGSSQDERVGNKIRTNKLTLKGTIVANQYNISSNPNPFPTVVQMFVFWDKLNPTVIPDPYAANDFFQFGSSTTDFRNDLVDTWAAVNTDRYHVVLRKQFKVGYSGYDGTASQPNAQYFQNNDFKFNQKFSIDLTKHAVKNVTFNDNSTVPTTRGLFVMWNTISATGGSLAVDVACASVQYSVDYRYTDL